MAQWINVIYLAYLHKGMQILVVDGSILSFATFIFYIVSILEAMSKYLVRLGRLGWLG